jgi:FlaA1/EpsC-like NDP-sugar epimerase
MVLFNNRYISSYRIILFLADAVLLLGSTIAGYYLRFGVEEVSALLRHVVLRGLFFTFVFQISLYYFDLYDFKIIRNPSKFGPRFLQSIAATLAILMISYYLIPYLYLGRGILLFTVSCATGAVFLWRIAYRLLVRGSQLNERIVILGSGDLAREISKEIQDHEDSGFKVVGHIVNQKETK